MKRLKGILVSGCVMAFGGADASNLDRQDTSQTRGVISHTMSAPLAYVSWKNQQNRMQPSGRILKRGQGIGSMIILFLNRLISPSPTFFQSISTGSNIPYSFCSHTLMPLPRKH